MILEVQRTSMSFKSWFEDLVEAGGSWLGLGILILILTWSLVFDFEGAKSFYILWVLIWGFGGSWRFLTWVWHLDLFLDMVTSLWYTHDPNFGSLSCFWSCKAHLCPLSPDLGLWRRLEVPDLGSSSWFLFGYGQWSLLQQCTQFWLSILVLKVQRNSISYCTLENTGVSWLGLCILI